MALVGPSGGGKSSIVKLVERFYLPAAGAVRMDGRDVGAYDEKWLRRRVGIVSQEPVLYGRRSACCHPLPGCGITDNAGLLCPSAMHARPDLSDTCASCACKLWFVWQQLCTAALLTVRSDVTDV